MINRQRVYSWPSAEGRSKPPLLRLPGRRVLSHTDVTVARSANVQKLLQPRIRLRYALFTTVLQPVRMFNHVHIHTPAYQESSCIDPKRPVEVFSNLVTNVVCGPSHLVSEVVNEVNVKFESF